MENKSSQITENIFQSVIGKSENILQAMTAKSKNNIYDDIKPIEAIRLSWTHYAIILQEDSKEARAWYENEAANEMWSTRTLQRNISSQYYHRMLQSQNKEFFKLQNG